MKPRRLIETRQLIASPEFQGWWESLLEARRLRDDARERHEELLGQAMLMDFRAELAQKNAIDTLYRAGELEDSAAKVAAECQALENASFKAVADFEEQRFRASEVWYRACAAERRVDALQDQVESRRQKRACAPEASKRELDVELGRLEAELKRVLRVQVDAFAQNERELAAKNRLWDEVERIWARSMEFSLLTAEKRAQSKKVRVEAERLFKQAEERKQRAQKLRAEAETAAREREAAEAREATVTKQAGEAFGCAQGEEFAYFRQRENPQRAWCLSLVEDSLDYNIEVKPLSLYSVDQKRGVEFLEPAVEVVPSDEEGDRRFEDYFLKGRKGRVPEEPPGRKLG